MARKNTDFINLIIFFTGFLLIVLGVSTYKCQILDVSCFLSLAFIFVGILFLAFVVAKGK